MQEGSERLTDDVQRGWDQGKMDMEGERKDQYIDLTNMVGICQTQLRGPAGVESRKWEGNQEKRNYV